MNKGRLSLSDVFKYYEDKDNRYLSWVGTVLQALSYPEVHISVNDGIDEWALSKTRNFEDIAECIESVDECELAFWSTKRATKNMFDKDSDERHSVEIDGTRYWLLGHAYINLFNSLAESVYDHTANDYMDLFCTNPNYKEKNYA